MTTEVTVAWKSGRTVRRQATRHPALLAIDASSRPVHRRFTRLLWAECEDIAFKAMASPYIQGIAQGNLHPENYGRYSLQDCSYCVHALACSQVATERATEHDLPGLHAFMVARQERFRAYSEGIVSSWHLKGVESVRLSQAAADYVELEAYVSEQLHPIYFLIAMTPCEHLWAWLASKLHEATSAINLYQFWIDNNNDWTGTIRLENFIDKFLLERPDVIDPREALKIYRSCMDLELRMFTSAFASPPPRSPTSSSRPHPAKRARDRPSVDDG